MVKRAIVRAMRPTACSQLPSWRWSWAPRKHSQPEIAARGVMNRKHTMSQNSVLFSLRGPGSWSHWGVTWEVENRKSEDWTKVMKEKKKKKKGLHSHIRAMTCVTSARGLGLRSMLNSVWQSSQKLVLEDDSHFSKQLLCTVPSVPVQSQGDRRPSLLPPSWQIRQMGPSLLKHIEMLSK